MKLLFVFLLSSMVFSSDKPVKYYQALNETKIYDYMKEAKPFATCLSKHGKSIDDVKTDQALEQVSDCFLSKLNDDELITLEERLKLKEIGLVQDNEPSLLRKYLRKRLMQGLYGDLLQTQNPELKKGKLKIINPELFFDLHKTQISNNILFDLSKFCLKNNNSSGKDEREKILNSLKSMNATKSSQMLTDCQRSIKMADCTQKKLDWNSDAKDLSVCAIKLRLREYKKVLTQIDSNKEAYFSTLKKDDTIVYQSQNFDFETYNGGKNDGEKSFQDLTNLTSYEAYEAYHEEDPDYFKNKKKKFMEVCGDNNLNEEECEKLVQKGEEEDFKKLKLAVLSEYGLRTKKYQKMKTKDEIIENLKNDFQLTDQEVKEYSSLSDKEIREKLNIVFNNYKKSVISELNEKFKERVLSSKSLNQQKKKLNEIGERILTEGELLQKVLNFHNAITSQYTFYDKNNQKSSSQYTRPLEAELEHLSSIKQKVNDPAAYEWISNINFKKSSTSEGSISAQKTIDDLLSP